MRSVRVVSVVPDCAWPARRRFWIMSHQVQLRSAGSHCPHCRLAPAGHAAKPPACRSRCLPATPPDRMSTPDSVPVPADLTVTAWPALRRLRRGARAARRRCARAAPIFRDAMSARCHSRRRASRPARATGGDRERLRRRDVPGSCWCRHPGVREATDAGRRRRAGRAACSASSLLRPRHRLSAWWGR